jgi:hypothetical protein
MSSSTAFNPATTGAQLNGASGLLFAQPVGAGVVSFTSALTAALTISTSAGVVTTYPAGTTGVQALPSSNGANNTFWQYANPVADAGRAWASAAIPNTSI